MVYEYEYQGVLMSLDGLSPKVSQRWPERAATFPTLSSDDVLSPEQEETLKDAITNRHEVSDGSQYY